MKATRENKHKKARSEPKTTLVRKDRQRPRASFGKRLLARMKIINHEKAISLNPSGMTQPCALHALLKASIASVTLYSSFAFG